MYTIKELKDMDYPSLSKQEQAEIVLDWLENGDDEQAGDYIDYFRESIVTTSQNKKQDI